MKNKLPVEDWAGGWKTKEQTSQGCERKKIMRNNFLKL